MQKKAVKMDTVVLEKPIRWTEMAFGGVDYIILDIFLFSLWKSGLYNC